MKQLLTKYNDKLVSQGLCDTGVPLICGLDDKLIWNRNSPLCGVLEEVIADLTINSLLFAKSAEPYFSIINYFIKDNIATIYPQDCETRTFLHDIPVTSELAVPTIIEALKRRKSIVIKDQGIVTFGIVSVEQAFIVYSSVCFAFFVKFFTDYLEDVRQNKVSRRQEEIFRGAVKIYEYFLGKVNFVPSFSGPFHDKEEVIKAMVEAAKFTVDSRMVDSFFGNISYRLGDTIYISQTASSLDELAGCIDPCPIDGSSCAGVTASSEYVAHRDILLDTDVKAILHGHPKFSVIMSMVCDDRECGARGDCHIKCPKKRFISDIAVVSGEVGTGFYGLCKTLPPAVKDKRGAIVYGHGLFTVGQSDFKDAFRNLVDIERMCFKIYLDRVKNGGNYDT
ncbi:MAG: class II aldolase/adducin family protein [Candidatus Omnitrophota bacterium]|nr:class II aldolase/adducin family protein [Candidatus Omnitrophota bacterium]